MPTCIFSSSNQSTIKLEMHISQTRASLFDITVETQRRQRRSRPPSPESSPRGARHVHCVRCQSTNLQHVVFVSNVTTEHGIRQFRFQRLVVFLQGILGVVEHEFRQGRKSQM